VLAALLQGLLNAKEATTLAVHCHRAAHQP
jgi:hypothetical protein